MLGSDQILQKVMLFQLNGHGHLKDDARPNFSTDSKSFLSGLQMIVSFVSEFLNDE